MMVYEPSSINDTMNIQLWGRMGSGGPPGLQNRARAGSASLSEFDSHALPPKNIVTWVVAVFNNSSKI